MKFSSRVESVVTGLDLTSDPINHFLLLELHVVDDQFSLVFDNLSLIRLLSILVSAHAPRVCN